MVNSMTGYAVAETRVSGWTATWELRSVNARGLDVRLRLPDGYGAFEAAARKAIGARFSRGNVQASLRLAADGGEAAPDHAAALDAVAEVRAAAFDRGIPLAPETAAAILALRPAADAAPQIPDAALHQGLTQALDRLAEMRATEGRALHAVLSDRVEAIAAGVAAARAAAAARAPRQAEALRTALAAVVDATQVDADRMAQELALLATRSDVAEELDRLDAHVAAARDLLSQTGPVGRRLDFLAQEFNREANTLCAKSSDTDLTRIGLDLKVAIDQVREQVQNVE